MSINLKTVKSYNFIKREQLQKKSNLSFLNGPKEHPYTGSPSKLPEGTEYAKLNLFERIYHDVTGKVPSSAKRYIASYSEEEKQLGFENIIGEKATKANKIGFDTIINNHSTDSSNVLNHDSFSHQITENDSLLNKVNSNDNLPNDITEEHHSGIIDTIIDFFSNHEN